MCWYKESTSWKLTVNKYRWRQSDTSGGRDTGFEQHHLHTLEIVEEVGYHTQNYNVLSVNEGIGLPEVLAILTPIEMETDKSLITEHDIVHKKAEETYCLQTTSAVRLPRTKFNYYINEFLFCIAAIDEAVKNVVPMSLQLYLLCLSPRLH